jgi:hypothetical protein
MSFSRHIFWLTDALIRNMKNSSLHCNEISKI